MSAQVKRKAPFFSWREAILASDLACTTKLVLLALSCHMNDLGESCFPSVALRAKESSLSRRAVITHLAIARKLGWVLVTEHGFGGQSWRRHEYVIGFPGQQKGGERAAPPLPVKVLNLVHEGGERVDKKVVNDVHCSTSLSTSLSTPREIRRAKTPSAILKTPSLQEVAEYCQRRKNGIDPQVFIDHYEACGWVQGNSHKPVKDWQACVRTWEHSRKERNGRAQKETEFQVATRLAKEKKLEPFRGAADDCPETAQQFVGRIKTSVGTAAFV